MAYCTTSPQLRDGKLAPTAISSVLVGYESKRRAYRIYHPESGDIFVSAQVTCDESIFPLEGTKEVRVAHDFATGAARGVPKYPSSDSPSKDNFRGSTTTSSVGYGRFAPLMPRSEETEISNDSGSDHEVSTETNPEPATTESDSMSTTQDSDIDLTDASSSRSETPDIPQVELAPTPRPPSPAPTYTVEVTENRSSDANVDRFVQIIEEQNRLLAQALEI